MLVSAAIIAIVAAGILGAAGLSRSASFFYAPGDLSSGRPAVGEAVRLGGMVKRGSVQHAPDGVSMRFVVEDGKAETPVRFTGIAPDLFREGSGVVAEGSFATDGSFIATNLLAKHDERYMPPELEGKMHKTDTLRP